MNTEIQTRRLHLCQFKESDYDDLFEFLSQLENDEFEGYPGINYENGRKYLTERLGSTEYYAVELMASGKVIGNIKRQSNEAAGNRDLLMVDYILEFSTKTDHDL